MDMDSLCLLSEVLCALPGCFQKCIWHDQYELLASITAGNIFGADMTLQETTQFSQKCISGSMTVCVVEGFKMIDVDHDDAQGMQVTRDPSQVLFQHFFHITAVI